MQKNKSFRFFLIGLCIVLFLAIRLYESTLFYDPLISFFKTEYHKKPLPKINMPLFFFFLFIRYSCNTILSLTIIYLLFLNKQFVKVSAMLYAFFIIIFLILFYFLIKNNAEHLTLFYTRRFIIQPLFLILFVPAFYFQQLNTSK